MKNNDTMAGNRRQAKSRRILRFLTRLLITMVVVYLFFGGFVFWAMHQPPEVFGRVMKRVPGPVAFLLYPFETLWLRARAGGLNVGDSAPDFSLEKVNKTGPIQLSVLNKQQPVVLVFGSYT